jgi:hypothetical protein
MAAKNGSTKSSKRKMKTSIGKSKNTVYNKAHQKKHGKKVYRGQGR